MILPAFVAALVLAPHPLAADPWTIKPPFSAGSKQQWALKLAVELGGQGHDATCDLTETTKDGDTSKGQPIHLALDNISVDGGSQPGGETDSVVTPQNMILSSADEDWRRSFTPLLFVYPVGPVSIGDKWKAEMTPTAKGAGKVNIDFTVKQIDSVNGADALMVTSKLTEAGDGGVSADGTWWIDKSGKVLKFKVVAKNWYAASANMSLDATFDATLKP